MNGTYLSCCGPEFCSEERLTEERQEMKKLDGVGG